MMDEQIINDYDDINIPEEENFIESVESIETLLVVSPDDIDISEFFFEGVKISGVMLFLSIGLVVILKIFYRA